MTHYELSKAVLDAHPLRFTEGRLWRGDDADWGVDLLEVHGLAGIDWRREARFVAEGAGGETLSGDVVIDAMDAAPAKATRIRLAGGGALAVGARLPLAAEAQIEPEDLAA